MQKYFYLIIAVFVLGGCSAVNELGDKYLGADKTPVTGQEIKKEFKENYLGEKHVVFDDETTRRLTFMAQEKIMASKYKDDFDLLSVSIDQDLMMPDALAYAFIHFNPKPEKAAQYEKTTYMVVIVLYGEKIVSAGLFKPPTGDPLYRYRDIIETIRKN
ncbi:MAG: hypothetical protein HQL24_09145 [Candidatus Omnitrophica bacterium]|nr:hypothetical protein [Candidatus Omnitrophota bacterium]